MIPCKFLNHEGRIIHDTEIPNHGYYKFMEVCFSKEPIQIMQEIEQQTLYTVVGVRTINSTERDIFGSPVVSCIYVKLNFHSVFYFE